ncbi:hypothetical protein CA13_50220 [Planctomycetes bacterium CA13]|uniref:Uncharacterized protein n=1 Tax=Novipirellula herctigrandis TaxID=2527986 RepID=A0A5C5Z8Z9_9BACT|nr:hypothetical protein CA13_50220 [Planctomycetes bacterium CA13]
MNVRFPFVIMIAATTFSLCTGFLGMHQRSFAQENEFGDVVDVLDDFGSMEKPVKADADDQLERSNLFESLSSSPSRVSPPIPSGPTDTSELRSRMTPAEMRQARAMLQAQQRLARLENRLWTGYEPLRPRWNSIPMTSSPYPIRRTIYVPIYVRN